MGVGNCSWGRVPVVLGQWVLFANYNHVGSTCHQQHTCTHMHHVPGSMPMGLLTVNEMTQLKEQGVREWPPVLGSPVDNAPAEAWRRTPVLPAHGRQPQQDLELTAKGRQTSKAMFSLGDCVGGSAAAATVTYPCSPYLFSSHFFGFVWLLSLQHLFSVLRYPCTAAPIQASPALYRRTTTPAPIRSRYRTEHLQCACLRARCLGWKRLEERVS